MSLKTRLLAVAALIVVLTSLAASIVFQRIVEGIIEQWGLHLVETQVRYDSARLLQPLEREIALARQLADSHVLKRWAAQPDDEALKAQAFEELESYRQNFRDQSYFVALLDSGAYYHNNAANEFAGQELRYHLDPSKADDAWFYQLVRDGKEFHLNVNPDEVLGVTKVWLDLLVRDGERILGIAGTGMALDDFLRDIVDLNQAGVTTLFVDGNGAIQLFRDPRLIDYASLVKPEGQKKTLDLLLGEPEDQRRVAAMMESLRQDPQPRDKVLTSFVRVEGKRYLAGIAFMPTLGWYEVTLLDLDELMPASRFLPLALIFLLTLGFTLTLLHIAVRHLLIDPLVALERAMVRVRDGHFGEQPLPRGQGEVGRLIEHFASMAAAIGDHTRELESKVQQRTEALERLARVDPLSELLNRRGMSEQLGNELERARRQGARLGLLWLDVDHFKDINDTLGHARGDQALQLIARVLQDNLRVYDQASRWGGDEFLVLLAPCDEAALCQIGERIRRQVQDASAGFGYPLAISLGAYLAHPGETLDQVLQNADDALYAAKAAGRNLLRLYSPPDDAPARSQTSQA